VLKVERSANGTVLFRLSGWIEKTDVEDLRYVQGQQAVEAFQAKQYS
jgi:hypothetical protein